MPKPPRGWKPGQDSASEEELAAAKSYQAAVDAHASAAAELPNSRREIKDSSTPVSISLTDRVTRVFSRPAKDSATPPQMPKRLPGLVREPRNYTARELLIRNVMLAASVVIFGFFANLLVLGHLQHSVAQQQLTNQFREELALATAPVSEGDLNLMLLPNGAPVAIIDIPALGTHEVVVEGTDPASLKKGPGHRRDTVLPGQAGISVLMARAAAYGGPFANLQSLQPGTEFSVITGQGYHVYSVIGVRYAGDPGPAEPAEGIGRIVLETARGGAFMPTGILRVDAQLVSTSPTAPGMAFPELKKTIAASTQSSQPSSSPVPSGTGTPISSPTASPTAARSSTPTPGTSVAPSGASTPLPGETGAVSSTRNVNITLASVKALDPGARFTGTNTLPLAERELATDTSTLWALIFGLQFLIVIEIAALWAYRRVGLEKTWIVFVPLFILSGLLISDQFVRLLPNLL
ncbi:hypothetical protein M2116_000638 [Aurantimicrobium minutum]|uniref:sortase domain-containing protein n=1 Tax=Aurantimicrobium minutum TaxID=708131 RepID=UPI002404F6FC|nr:sortase [Aurantimicrobium minutum]MDF9809694.1 hypothetical protein [Aurantimicrobium minutum]